MKSGIPDFQTGNHLEGPLPPWQRRFPSATSWHRGMIPRPLTCAFWLGCTTFHIIRPVLPAAKDTGAHGGRPRVSAKNAAVTGGPVGRRNTAHKRWRSWKRCWLSGAGCEALRWRLSFRVCLGHTRQPRARHASQRTQKKIWIHAAATKSSRRTIRETVVADHVLPRAVVSPLVFKVRATEF